MKICQLLGIYVTALPFLVSCLGAAQVNIKKPKQVDVPVARVQQLHRVICRAVADEFRLKPSEVKGPVTLVLRAGNESVGRAAPGRDEPFAIYLDHWGEAAFTATDMELSIQRLLSRDRRKKLIREVVRRIQQSGPISTNQLQGANTVVSPQSLRSPEDCPSAISNASPSGCRSLGFPNLQKP